MIEIYSVCKIDKPKKQIGEIIKHGITVTHGLISRHGKYIDTDLYIDIDMFTHGLIL